MNDLLEAIQKREEAIRATEKKKKIIKIATISLAAAIIIGLIIYSVIIEIHNSELRNFASDSMNDDYTNVYADIVSMKPEYFIYMSSSTSYYGITEVVCKCKTVEGYTVWASISSWKYPGGDSRDEESYKEYYYSASNPMRLIGSVTTSENVYDNLPNWIGDVYVLNVNSLQND